jgi:hypothetical protein
MCEKVSDTFGQRARNALDARDIIGRGLLQCLHAAEMCEESFAPRGTDALDFI